MRVLLSDYQRPQRKCQPLGIVRRNHRMRDTNCSVPELVPAVLESAARNRQRMRFTQRSKPAGALHAPLDGTYVHVRPPSLEYSIAAVTPAGSVTDAVDSLNCVTVGIESTIATPDALAFPMFVTVDLNVRSVPGSGDPVGVTVFPIVIAGFVMLITSSPVEIFA